MYSWIERKECKEWRAKWRTSYTATFGVKSKKKRQREGERENQRVFQTQCCITASCQWQEVKGAALLQLVYPADLAGRGVCVLVWVWVCATRGGDMLCSLHLSGGQEWTMIPVAQFYPSGCTRAVNGSDMEPYVSVWVSVFIYYMWLFGSLPKVLLKSSR